MVSKTKPARKLVIKKRSASEDSRDYEKIWAAFYKTRVQDPRERNQLVGKASEVLRDAFKNRTAEEVTEWGIKYSPNGLYSQCEREGDKWWREAAIIAQLHINSYIKLNEETGNFYNYVEQEEREERKKTSGRRK